jgi:hypothetical protein
MLREIQNTRQIAGESPRRWFHSSEMDLIVWLSSAADDEIIGFQLCYDKVRGEKALHWKADRGFSHMDVDDGEDTAGKHKASPLLMPDGAFDSQAVQRRFSCAAQTLPDDIRNFVENKLGQAF